MSQQSATTATGTERKIRVLIAKPGLDGHDRGAKVVTRGLRDAGMEVIYTGLHQTPEMIVEAALQEDVDAIGLSILSGAHNVLFPRVMKLLVDNGMDDVVIFAGGIIPPEDEPEILKLGVGAVFGPGTTIEQTAKFIRENVRTHGVSGETQNPASGTESWVDNQE